MSKQDENQERENNHKLARHLVLRKAIEALTEADMFLHEDKPTFPVGVSVLLTRGPLLLMGVRKKAAGNAEGMLSTPGGRIEPGEHYTEAASRELREETGIEVTPGHFREIGFRQHHRFGMHYFMVYVTAECSIHCDPENREPEKCERWLWMTREMIKIYAGGCTEPEEILAIAFSAEEQRQYNWERRMGRG